MEDVTIRTGEKLFGPDIHSILATVKAPASTGKTTPMNAGQLVFLAADASGYEALTAAGTTAVGVLAEPITPTSSGVKAKVVIWGDVYIEGVRAAGDSTSYISDMKLIHNASKIHFIDEKNMEV